MLWAAFTLAFSGFLRSSEFTCNVKFDPHIHLSRADINFIPNIFSPIFLVITIKKSKTDPFREAAELTIARSNSNVCAVSALHFYLLQHTDRVPPILSSNSPMGAVLPEHRLPTMCMPYSMSVAWTVQTSPHTAFVLAQPQQREQLDFLIG